MQNVMLRASNYVPVNIGGLGSLSEKPPHDTAAMNDPGTVNGSSSTGVNNRQPARNELKIVIAGNVGSGKTTSIKTISEIPYIGSEAKATERDALHRKETTTVSMEYGMAHIANMKLHLYGTPGQRRFDFMADILCKGAHGMVVMIDNGCANPLQEIDYFLRQHDHFLQRHPGIIAITHFDDDDADTNLLEYHAYVIQNGFTCPVMVADARNKDDMQKVLMRLLLQIAGSKTGKM